MNATPPTASVVDNTTYLSILDPTGHNVLVITILFQIFVIVRVYSFSVHVFYFFLIFKITELQRISLLYVHHTNVISFLFNLHYLIYYDFLFPNFADKSLNNVLCTISEIAWAMLKLLRTYSIALIALYRLVAVFKVTFYKAMNKRVITVILPLIGVYLLCIMVVLANKYSFGTSYGMVYCMDGFSPYLSHSLAYFFVSASVGYVLPVVFAVIAYEVIKRKLNKLSTKTKHKSAASGGSKQTRVVSQQSYSIDAASTNLSMTKNGKLMASTSESSSKSDYDKQQKLAKQFLVMDVCEIMSTVCVIGLGMRYVVPDLNNYYNIFRYLLMTFNLIFQSMVPVAAMIYNPDICKQISKWKKKFFAFVRRSIDTF